MKFISLLVSFILLLSCSSQKDNRFETISLREALKDDLSVLDSIGIIPLETADSILVKDIMTFQYLKKPQLYLIMDDQQYVYLFDETGKCVANSSACKGEGSQEYFMAVDAVYNPYSDAIEIYNPMQGILHSYDMSFHWLNVRELDHEAGFHGSHLEVIGENQYILDPLRLHEDCSFVRLYDFSRKAGQVITNMPCYKEGYVCRASAHCKMFTMTNTAVYFTPSYLDYHYYKYDVEQKLFSPLYKLDVGTKEATARQLEELYGKAVSNSSDGNVESINIMEQKEDYLVFSDYLLPTIRLISDLYVYAFFQSNMKASYLIHNRQTRETFYISQDAGIDMFPCYALYDNVLFGVLYPDRMDKYVDDRAQAYMSMETRRKLKDIKEEDNPVIIKYYLKK